MRRQIDGEMARFFPPGHSSAVNSIGQFSMPMRISCFSANVMIGFQVRRKGFQFASTDLVQSRPTNVLTFESPSFFAARMTCLMCATAVLASSRFGESGFG